MFYLLPDLKLQAALAGAICELLHAAVVHIAAAIEYDVLNALSLAALSNELANLLGCFLVAAVLGEVLLSSRGGYQGNTGYIVNNLCIDVLCRTEYVQTGTLSGAADLSAYALVALQTRLLESFFETIYLRLSFPYFFLAPVLPSLRRTNSSA